MPLRTRSVVIGLVALVGLAACGSDSSGNPPTSPNPDTTTTTETTTTTPASTTTATPSTTTTAPPDDLTAAVTAFQEWVAALAEGDVDSAWDLMATSSQLAFGSYDRFAGMRTGFAEGWGSWVAVADPSYSLDEDDAGRILLIASGVIRPEGTAEYREVGVPLVEENGQILLSPFEEFGNVANGLEQVADGVGESPVPSDSGAGRRIVYSNSDQRVWLVEADGTVSDTYLVSGKQGVPAPGTYEVFSKSEAAFAGHDDITMSHMVRFAHGTNLPIGFHAIPNDGNGRPLQKEEELGEFHSAGCVRQSPGHAAHLFAWADIGTAVVVLP
jgi:hypothetical protein